MSGIMGLAYPALYFTISPPQSMPSVIIAQQHARLPRNSTPIRQFKRVQPPILHPPLHNHGYPAPRPPVFSIALNHEGSSGPAGYLALDGLPPVATQGCWASTPVLPQLVDGAAKFMWYVINLDSLVVSGHEVPNCGSTK